jgi:hypothetical protein
MKLYYPVCHSRSFASVFKNDLGYPSEAKAVKAAIKKLKAMGRPGHKDFLIVTDTMAVLSRYLVYVDKKGSVTKPDRVTSGGETEIIRNADILKPEEILVELLTALRNQKSGYSVTTRMKMNLASEKIALLEAQGAFEID